MVSFLAGALADCGGKSARPGADPVDLPTAGASNVSEAGAASLSEAGAPSLSEAGADSEVEAGGAAPTEPCPESPPSVQPAGTVITFQTDPYLGGQPLVFGTPNALPGGGTLTPLNFRYFISNVVLVRADGRTTRVDMVSESGTLEPYGVHLFNSEDHSSTAWSIRAPAGDYRGIDLTLGLTAECNTANQGRKAPLDADSQLTWPPPFNYLFLRFEGQIVGAKVGADGAPVNGQGEPWVSAIAMGGLQGTLFAPVVRIEAPLSVPAAGGPIGRSLRFDVQQMFNGANADVDLTNFPGASVPPPSVGGAFGPPGGDETIAGERLRQSAPNLPLFTLDP